MLRAKSETLGIKSISDLGNAYKSGKTMPIGVNAEFSQRPDGLPGVQKVYGFTVPLDSIVKMDFGLSFQALRDGQVESAMVTYDRRPHHLASTSSCSPTTRTSSRST